MIKFRRALTIGAAAATISIGVQPAPAQNAEQGSPQQLAQSSEQAQQQLEQARAKLQEVQQLFERATGAATDLSAAKQSARYVLSQAEAALKQIQLTGGQQMQEAAKKAEASVRGAMQTINQMQTISQTDPQLAAQALKETNRALGSVGKQASSSGASLESEAGKPDGRAEPTGRTANGTARAVGRQADWQETRRRGPGGGRPG